jgi:hypothetical protein
MSVPLSAAGGTGKAELWDCGRGLVFLELSARLDTSEAGGALTQLKAELRRRGLHLAAAGTTKTELALRHLLRAPTGVVRS